jgi:hypothetical protein
MADPAPTFLPPDDKPPRRRGVATLKGGGSGDSFDPMETRVAVLEAHVEHIRKDIADVKTDLREMRQEMKDMRRDTQSEFTTIRREMRNDFIILFGALIAAVLGLAALMAKGFHWI